VPCRLHPDGSPVRPAEPFTRDQCILCYRAAGGVHGGVKPAPARKPLPVCPHLDATEVRLPGSSRTWRKCLAGYGSTAGDGRKGLVCGCATETPGVFRRGKECGPACPGFPAG
jgi:hypothetical protein